ncbi:MAG: hypothetical protein Tsb0020_35340 [Haliangiales bacterium]
MNTTRIDTVLNRQRSNLVFDSVYAAIIVVGLLISLFGLSLTPALARSVAPTVTERPAITYVDSAPNCGVETHAKLC